MVRVKKGSCNPKAQPIVGKRGDTKPGRGLGIGGLLCRALGRGGRRR